MDTEQTRTSNLVPTATGPRRRHPPRATMGADWQIGFSPRRPALAPEPIRPAAPNMDLGAWLSRLFGLGNDEPTSEGARQPLAPVHPGR